MTSTANRPIAILSAPGSRGDVNPMVAIGRELRRQGFDVVISLAENYVEIAEAAGLQAEVLISRAQFDAWLGDRNVWKPLRGARLVLRESAGAFIEPHLDVIRRHHRPQQTILVAHPLDFASRIHRDVDASTPLVSVQLSPAIVRNAQSPPRLSPWWLEFQRPPWLVSARYAVVDYLLADRFLGPSINRARKRLGLSPVNRIMDRWWLSPDLVLGMYPDWFSSLRPACTGRWQACGFPLDDTPSLALPPKTSGPPPQSDAIFITPGTAHRYAHELFANAIAACEKINRPCILATSYPEQLPKTLPDHVTPMGYAPLDPLLRSCAAIVHHGGIGTTSMALVTACPQLICPLAFDQFHNVDRVTELGVGRECKTNLWRHRRSAVDEMAAMLFDLTQDPEIRGRCQKLAGQQVAFRGASVAATAVHDLLREAVKVSQ